MQAQRGQRFFATIQRSGKRSSPRCAFTQSLSWIRSPVYRPQEAFFIALNSWAVCVGRFEAVRFIGHIKIRLPNGIWIHLESRSGFEGIAGHYKGELIGRLVADAPSTKRLALEFSIRKLVFTMHIIASILWHL